MYARTLRANNLDSHYVACIFKMMKWLGIVAAEVIKKFLGLGFTVYGGGSSHSTGCLPLYGR
jgi:hypothetical protein